MIERSTPLYRLVIEALEIRRRELGWTLAVCDAKAGLQNGYTAKMFRPDTPSGRIARWETMQLLVDAMYAGCGFRLWVIPDVAPMRMPKGAPTPTARLLAALCMSGMEGFRAAKLLHQCGFEITAEGAIITNEDQADQKRRNRRHFKTRETVNTRTSQASEIKASQ